MARRAPSATPLPAGPAPGEVALHEAAVAHLARYAATRAGLVRVLDRRIARWQRAAEAEGREAGEEAATARAQARAVADRLVAQGLVDDAAFAASRARRLARAGRSRRAVAAHLAAKGIDGATARDALPEDPEAELAAALALARRRRIGPFRAGEADAEARQRELAILARAGFGRDVATRALRLDPEAAEERLLRFRQD
jgi:regulatory protein